MCSKTHIKCLCPVRTPHTALIALLLFLHVLWRWLPVQRCAFPPVCLPTGLPFLCWLASCWEGTPLLNRVDCGGMKAVALTGRGGGLPGPRCIRVCDLGMLGMGGRTVARLSHRCTAKRAPESSVIKSYVSTTF